MNPPSPVHLQSRINAFPRSIRLCNHFRARLSVLLLVLLLAYVRTLHAQLPVIQDVMIQTSDSITLEATIIKPLGNPPSGGFPGIVLVHGFGGNKENMRSIGLSVAGYGYASLAYSVRGQGNSGGVSTIDGDRERLDLREVIDYFRQADGINSNELGVAGGSQGGIHSWMAAAYHMPGVRAVAPLLATPDFARALVPNGCVKYGLARELNLSSVRYGEDRDRMRRFIVGDQYDSVLAYIDSRDLARFIDSIHIPVFQGLGWADFLFPVNGGIRARARLAERHVPIRSYFGTNGHGEPINALEASYLLQNIISWFDRWLKGFSLDQDSLPLVLYSDDRPDWPHHTTAVWPPEPSGTLRLYFTQTGLSFSSSSIDSSISVPFSLEYDSTYTPATAWDSSYRGPAFVAAFHSVGAHFLSDTLTGDVELTGTPSGQIFVGSDAAKFQSHVRFYDVAGDTGPAAWSLMSRSMNGIRQNTPGQVHQIAIEGTALSHIIPAGHRIGVEVTSLDMLSDEQSNVIPFFVSSHSRLISSTSSYSYVDIPVVGSLPVAVRDRRAPVATHYTLAQNYPNPFNPSTVIRYQLPASGFVTLTIFDLLGQEVASLVHGQQEPGEYSVTWNAGSYPSGVYFYRLEAGSFSETRKLLLLR